MLSIKISLPTMFPIQSVRVIMKESLVVKLYLFVNPAGFSPCKVKLEDSVVIIEFAFFPMGIWK